MPHYAAVEPQGKGLMVASEKPFAFTHVDGRPVEQPDPEPMEVEKTGGWCCLEICQHTVITVVSDFTSHLCQVDPLKSIVQSCLLFSMLQPRADDKLQ